ncbi:MAG: dihydropteroate synthase [Candidatus Margulisbacteria bacterium]|nr:dihydropteroate synthase [Candidatus Margulisiibacteriota bacterium]
MTAIKKIVSPLVYLYKLSTDDWPVLFDKIGVDAYAYEKLAAKNTIYFFYLKNIPAVAANIIKQEALSKGGEAVVSRETMVKPESLTDVLLTLNGRQLQVFCSDLADQPFGLKELAGQLLIIKENVMSPLKPVKIGKTSFDFNKKPFLMGILNVTPDSFSDGGKFDTVGKAVTHAAEMLKNGADIIDIGGESTRPGSREISAEEESARVLPVIKAILKKFPGTLISIDTWKAEVAEKALKAGAVMVNDISAGTFDAKMFQTIARYKVPVVLMHTPGKPRSMQKNIRYNDLLTDIYTFFQERIKVAVNQGVKKELIIIDPGIGFGKKLEHNLELIKRINIFRGLGRPILLGPSRKRFIGDITGRDEAGRMPGTAVAVALGVNNGANIVRVHDVKELKDVLLVTTAIMKGGSYA